MGRIQRGSCGRDDGSRTWRPCRGSHRGEAIGRWRRRGRRPRIAPDCRTPPTWLRCWDREVIRSCIGPDMEGRPALLDIGRMGQMVQNDTKLLAGFDQALRDVSEAAKRLKPPYHPTAFRQMLAEHGGKGTADRLLAASNPSSGFTELFLRGRENLKLSLEYVVLQSPWRTLFTADQLAIARRRLLDVGCELPVDNTLPEQPPYASPDEVLSNEKHVEGASRQVLVNTFERNAAARSRCIAHYGTACVVCGFDFGRAYGAIADGYIHVHHLKPLSTINKEYEVDPIADLRPVCANCHSVIHLGRELRTIEEVRRMMAASRDAKDTAA